MSGNTPFPEAEAILWDLDIKDGENFKILTSAYWLGQDDIIAEEFEGSYVVPEEVAEG